VRGIDAAELDPADPDERRMLIEAEHPGMLAAIKAGRKIKVGPSGISANPKLHVTMHEIVANQLWDGELHASGDGGSPNDSPREARRGPSGTDDRDGLVAREARAVADRHRRGSSLLQPTRRPDRALREGLFGGFGFLGFGGLFGVLSPR
jgi:hypothetical protein